MPDEFRLVSYEMNIKSTKSSNSVIEWKKWYNIHIIVYLNDLYDTVKRNQIMHQ